jgi:hypothetical protein
MLRGTLSSRGKGGEERLGDKGLARDQSYQSVSRETFWYDLDQESYKPALITRRELVRSRGKQITCRDSLGILHGQVVVRLPMLW